MHKDASGRALRKGDFVAYSGGAGRRSGTGLKFGYVFALKEKTVDKNVYNQTTKQYDKVPETHYRIQVVTAERRWNYSHQTGQPGFYSWALLGKTAAGEGNSRLASVEMLERVIIVEPHQLPPDARALLEKDMLERGIQ